MAHVLSWNRRAVQVAGWLALASAAVGVDAQPVSNQSAMPAIVPPQKLSWYGDPSAPDISGIWVRTGSEGQSASKEGWLPWAPPLKPHYAAIWRKRVADAAAGKRTDDPIRACMPAGMPRFVTGMTPPMQIIQTPGRVIMYRDGMPVRRIWLDGRPLPRPRDLESFSNGNATGRYVGTDLVTSIAGIKDQPIDTSGIPHSDDLTIVERYHRIDAQTLRVTVTLTDKTAFTRTMTSVVIYKLHSDPLWEPQEFLCTPQTGYAPERYVQ
ncbi:MAG: hypothetical protein RL367_1042 [Pseudomonadota bacterium]